MIGLAKRLLSDSTSNVRLATAEKIERLYKLHNCFIDFSDVLEDRLEIEPDPEVKKALDLALDIALRPDDASRF